jgi:protein-disulfide isomerase
MVYALQRVFVLSLPLVSVFLTSRSHASDKQQTDLLFQIDGRQFSLKDVAPAEQNRLYEIELSRYRAIEGLARQRFVELKSAPFSSLNSKDNPFAAEEKWLKLSFEPASSEIDKALETFKDERQLQQLPAAERGKVIARYLASQKRMKFLTEVTDKAIEKGEIKIALNKPEAPLVEIARSAQAVLGDPKNSIRVVEFTDFQCPYCKKMSNVSSTVLKKYGRQIVWEVRHYPLSFHKQARDAAAAVYCASVQGKLSEAKSWVFEAQEKLAEEKIFSQMAKTLSLNVAQFDKCRSDDATAKLIDADMREGERVGVSGTPTVFVNGRKFQGDPQSLEAWDEMINAAQTNSRIR